MQSTNVHPPQHQCAARSKHVFALLSLLPFTIATDSHDQHKHNRTHHSKNPHTTLTQGCAACCCSSAPLQSPLPLLPQCWCHQGCAQDNEKSGSSSSSRETKALVGSMSQCVRVHESVCVRGANEWGVKMHMLTTTRCVAVWFTCHNSTEQNSDNLRWRRGKGIKGAKHNYASTTAPIHRSVPRCLWFVPFHSLTEEICRTCSSRC